jgi:hypothetical protein
LRCLVEGNCLAIVFLKQKGVSASSGLHEVLYLLATAVRLHSGTQLSRDAAGLRLH